MMQKNSSQSGFALLLSVIVASIVLAIGLTMLNVAIKQLTLSATARESEFAFQAATAGQDCIRYWRLVVESVFFDPISGVGAPNISCLSAPSEPATKLIQSQSVYDTDGDNYTNYFEYQIDWGTGAGARCTEIDLYAMTASSTDYTVDFGSAGIVSVGSSGQKTCSAFTKCTVVVTRGYNRACADLAITSALNVQREITSEY